jgi:hypothetical protein
MIIGGVGIKDARGRRMLTKFLKVNFMIFATFLLMFSDTLDTYFYLSLYPENPKPILGFRDSGAHIELLGIFLDFGYIV